LTLPWLRHPSGQIFKGPVGWQSGQKTSISYARPTRLGFCEIQSDKAGRLVGLAFAGVDLLVGLGGGSAFDVLGLHSAISYQVDQ
jgi:hypothetical protein